MDTIMDHHLYFIMHNMMQIKSSIGTCDIALLLV